ncbi:MULTISPECIES: helix-turn-helix domain-containing protein [Amycolatopsis]|uniref:helix-turn-helix domain-containing protein n=1 Tax=Amycolatopsis TaxID=1813 RepID=UPI003319768C
MTEEDDSPGEHTGTTEREDDLGSLNDELVRLYNDGETIESLAARYALSYHKVRTTLLAAGVTLRPPKIQLPPTPPGLVNAYLAGRSIRQLADIHGMSYNQTRRILLAEGVTLRPRGRQQ